MAVGSSAIVREGCALLIGVNFGSITYEGKATKTKVKNNAGGSVEFDETLSFSKKVDKHVITARIYMFTWFLFRFFLSLLDFVNTSISDHFPPPWNHPGARLKKQVAVRDSNVMSDAVLAEKEIDLSKLALEDWVEFIENAQPIPFQLKDRDGKHAGTVFLGFSACTIQVKIYHIENFPDTAGFMDKTDPFVK